MKKDIIFTTETDGLVKHKLVNEKYIHLFPNMLKIVIGLPNQDSRMTLLVDNRIDIPEKITKINGITNELIEEFGVAPLGVLDLLKTIINEGDCLVSHNVEFHLAVLKAFYFRLGEKFPEVSTKCLQKSLIDVVKKPFNEEDPDSGFKKPSVDHLKEFYSVEDFDKFQSLRKIYNLSGEHLIEESPIKPASF